MSHLLLLIGAGWIAGLGGVTAATTASLLEGWGRRRHRRRGSRWPLLLLVLMPACEVQCEFHREPRDARGKCARVELESGAARAGECRRGTELCLGNDAKC